MELLYLYWILQGLIFDMIGSIFIVKGLYPMYIPDDKKNHYYDLWQNLEKFLNYLSYQETTDTIEFNKDVDNYYKINNIEYHEDDDYPTEKFKLRSLNLGKLRHNYSETERLAKDAYTNFRHYNNIRQNKLQHKQALFYAKKGLIFLLGGFSLIFLGTLFLFKINNL